MNELIKTLVEAYGPSGFEDQMRALIRAEIADLADEISVDAMGNLIALKKGDGSGLKVMIAAHMDEIGFIVKHIDNNGFIKLQPLGGFDPRQLFSQRVLVHGFAGKSLRGVLTYNTKPAHMLTAEEGRAAPKLENFFVDLGMDVDAVKAAVRAGDMATMDRSAERCGANVIGKSLDNRVGVFVMIEAMKLLKETEADVYAVATTQEEIGLRGATTAAFAVDPDIGIGLDTTLACDYPGASDDDVVTRLGGGVGIKIMDSAMVSHPKLVDHFRTIAERDGITHQMEILPRGGTDGGALQRTRGGTVSITLSVPTRYIHTVNEMNSVADIEATIRLLATYLGEAHLGNYALDG